MALVILSKTENIHDWIDTLKSIDPEINLYRPEDVPDPGIIKGALLWHHPHGSLLNYPNIEWASSLGAGVDHILSDKTIPGHIKITRIVDQYLTSDMADTALMAALMFKNRMHQYIFQQREHIWKKHEPVNKVATGVMGLGEMGRGIADKLYENEFEVYGYSTSRKEIPGITTYHGEDQLDEFLKKTDVLFIVLPFTKDTSGMLNLQFFNKMKRGSFLVNLARGMHLVEEDLLQALNEDILSGAFLDVFKEEPLPENHPFWNHPKIVLTPHVASVTRPKSAARLIAENYHRVKDNKDLLYEIDRERGY